MLYNKNSIGEKGVQIVMNYLTGQGYECSDVQKKIKERGCDILANKNCSKYKIEVKTSQKSKGIPDCYFTEFDETNKFIPDFLYVVRLDENFKLLKIQFLTKKEINSYEHKRTERIILSSTLKNDLNKGKIGKEV